MLVDKKPEPLSKNERLRGGITVHEVTKWKNSIEATEAKMEKLRGDSSADYKAFEEAGGNKAAFKLAKKINAMSIDEGRDFLQTLKDYLHAMGTFEQLDLFFDFLETEKVELEAGEPDQGQEIAKAVLAHQATLSASAH